MMRISTFAMLSFVLVVCTKRVCSFAPFYRRRPSVSSPAVVRNGGDHASAAPGCSTSRRETTFLSQSNVNDDDDDDDNNENVTLSSSKGQSANENDELVPASEEDDPFREFAAFLSDNATQDNDDTDKKNAFTLSQDSSNAPVDTTALWFRLLALASRTGRGEFATEADAQEALSYIQLLELENPTPHPTLYANTNSSKNLMNGKWQLLYSDTQLFRSSPFFMAGRAVCKDGDQAQQYNWFCDMHRKALAISNIGAVRQIVSNTSLTSEFEVKVGSVPFVGVKPPFPYSGGLPLTIDGSIVSSADFTPAQNGTAWELYMDTVQIKGSNIPGLRKLLDGGLQLSSRKLASVLESTISSYSTPKPVFRTTYLDANMRISRDQDDHVFVYSKVSNDTALTDYSNVAPDLGVSKLLEGFNDAVTKIYL